MAADEPTNDDLKEWYGELSGWRMTTEEVEILLVIRNKGAEIKSMKVYIKINVANTDGAERDRQGKFDRIVALEAFYVEKLITTMSLQSITRRYHL